jgi:hypothetical protein
MKLKKRERKRKWKSKEQGNYWNRNGKKVPQDEGRKVGIKRVESERGRWRAYGRAGKGEQEEGSYKGRYSNEGAGSNMEGLGKRRIGGTGGRKLLRKVYCSNEGAGRKKETEQRRIRQIKEESVFETRMVGLCRLEYEEGRKGREEEGV